MEANLDETVKFLASLPRLNYETLCVMDPDTKEITAKSFSVEDQESIKEWLAPYQGTHNCYFHVNEGPKGRRAKKSEVTRVRMLHVDIDDLTDTILDRVRNFSLTPSIVVMSGGGYQAFWFFSEIQRANSIFEELNKRILHHFNADDCFNIDRLMRLPGTINMPDAKKRAAGRGPALAYIEDSTLTQYTQDQLYTSLPVPAQLPIADVTPTRLADLDPTLKSNIPTDIQELIEFGDTKEQFPSRSEAVWRVSNALARLDFPDAIVVALYTHKDNKIAESILERSDPRAEALRQYTAAKDATSTGWIDVGAKGAPKASLANAQRAISRLGIDGCYDSFRGKQYLILNNELEERNDLQEARVRDVILRRFHFDPGADFVFSALTILCAKNEIHSIRDAFPRLKWDGQRRLQHLLSWYFGAEDTVLHREMSEIFLVACVRRVMQPGCKFDNIIVLEGPQGTGKSSALAILADQQNFSDQDILIMNAQQQAEAIRGVWIFEISELAGMHKTDVDKIKSFASRNVDMVRPAYGRHRVDVPRQCVFVGTANEDVYLRDTTGNRRFWPVKTTNIRLQELQADRIQLWAEAVQMEATGRSIVLSESLWKEVEVTQNARVGGEIWTDYLRELPVYQEQGLVRVSSIDALEHLGVSPSQQNNSTYFRLRDAMRMVGWTGPKLLKINKQTVRGYEADPSRVSFRLIGEEIERPTTPRPSFVRGVIDGGLTVGGKPAFKDSE